ncbi:MAG: hypothetical protein ABJN26_19915 [Stappiaceae bacterium]
MASEKDKPAGPRGKTTESTGPSGSGSGGSNRTDGEQKTGSSFASGAKQPSKPAVTIDLKAKEVKSPPEKTEKPDGDKSKTSPTMSAGNKSGQSAGGVKQTGKTTSDKPEKKTGPQSASAASGTAAASASQAGAKAGSGSSASSKASTPPPKAPSSATTSKPSTGSFQTRPPSAAASQPKSSVGFFGVLTAAAIGGLIVLAGGYGLVESGYVKLGDDSLASRVAAIETSGRDDFEALKSTVADQASSASEALDNGLSALKTQFDEISGRVADIAATPVADPTQSAAVKETVDALSEQVKALREAVSSGSAGDGAAAASLNEALKSVKGQFETFQQASSAELEALKKQLSEFGGEGSATQSLQQAVAGLANQFKTAQTSGKTTEELVTTQGDTLQTMQSQFVGLSGQLSTTQEQIAGIAKNAETLSKSLTEIENQLNALTSRTETVEEAVGSVSARELASRAIAISSLKDAVDDGRSFATELAAVSKLLPEGTDLSLLQQNSEEGIETSAQLIAGFPNVARSMGAALNQAEAGDDVLDQLLTNARSLVTIRRSGEDSSSDPSSLLGSMASKVGKADLAGALSAYENLPEAARQAGAPWANAVKTRLEADSLVSKVTKDVIESLAASAH